MIGIFDSGVGGMSVLREVRKILPDQPVIYYADSAHCPYGEKSKEYIIGRARFITETLMAKGASVIVVACNTATAAAIAALRQEYPQTPFIGMEPAIKPAALRTRTGVVGVLATAGTLKAQKYIDTREQYSEGIKVVEHIGQGFVELVEKGILTGPEAEKTISASLKPLLDEGADVIVLGCTHYPFLTQTIQKAAQTSHPERDIQIIDPAPAVAKQLLKVMTEKGLLDSQSRHSETIIMSSSDSSAAEDFYRHNVLNINADNNTF
jgi:glutamate racemase